MPGLPLAVRENPNSGHYQNHSRTVDLSAEEAIAAEESFEVYCKPVELYNILQRRSIKNPLFPQRCLSYKTEAKCKRRIHMTISFSGILNAGVEVQKILPLHILLARPNPYIATGGQHHTVYSIKQACIIAASSEFESRGRSKATFILPEIKKLLAEALSSKLTILFVSAEKKNLSYERNPFDNSNNTSYPSVGGYCLCGEIPIEFLNWTPETCVNLSSVNGAELLSTVDMKSCFLERCSLNVGSNISFKFMDKPGTMHVQVKFFAQEIGAKDGSPYHSYVHENVPTSLLPQIARLRSGNVLFNYKYYNGRLEKIEPTSDFCCAFCHVECASFKGLGKHLCASHDLFNYEFLVTREVQAVYVSVKSDIEKSEDADGSDPRKQTFFFCSKPRKRRRSNNLSGNGENVHPHVIGSLSLEVAGESFLEDLLGKEDGASSVPMPSIRSPLDTQPSNDMPHENYENVAHSSKEMDKASSTYLCENDLERNRHTESNGIVDASTAERMERVASSPNVTSISTARVQSGVAFEGSQQESGSNVMLQFGKTRRLSIERSDPRNHTLLQKRQFFHSHRAQLMAMDQVLSEQDSEDEIDDNVAEFEDRRMLDDFVDVTKDEKRIMHLWNSFVRKQRVLADGHIPWAWEAFSRLHALELVQSPKLMWCWKLLMIKLWNHSLLDAHTMDKCSKIFRSIENESSNP